MKKAKLVNIAFPSGPPPTLFKDIVLKGTPGSLSWRPLVGGLPSAETEGARPSAPHLVQLGVACVVGLTQQTLSCMMLTPKQETLGCGGKRRLFLLSHWQWGHRAPELPTNPNLVPQPPVRSGSHGYHHLHYPCTCSQLLNSSLLWLAGVNLYGLHPGTLTS